MAIELSPQPIIEVYSDRRVLIEHHFGILEYCECCIRIKVKFGVVRVSGSGLIIANMTKEKIVVCGKICGVELCKEDV